MVCMKIVMFIEIPSQVLHNCSILPVEQCFWSLNQSFSEAPNKVILRNAKMHHLDEKHVVFGQVVDGEDVISYVSCPKTLSGQQR